MQGTVVTVAVVAGDGVKIGSELVVLESMKMEHAVNSSVEGVAIAVHVTPGDLVVAGQLLVELEGSSSRPEAPGGRPEETPSDGLARPDLSEARERHRIGLDEARPEAVARRHASGRRTARENIADLCDPGSFVEYGPLVIAAQRRRRSIEDLIANTPADGLVGGVGAVAGRPVIAMSYDYTVLAGTQGLQNHQKKDRLFELAWRRRIPVVLFGEGGGGRPGDTDRGGPTGLDCAAFALFAKLSARVPLVGVNGGMCFAGNAALLGCCDVVIATVDSNIGMGGPAMIEGGGLGTFAPSEIGPAAVQSRNGVLDVVVADEAEAVAVAKRYLSYFGGRAPEAAAPDQELLRHVVPRQRLRGYDMRRAVDLVCDEGSVLELREAFGVGMITALARVDSRAIGVIANNPMHLGGAIDADAADKAARFMQLCEAFRIPILFLCDTPGIMVGPEAEEAATVRHVSRMFVTGASLTVPFGTIVLRKGYGLGAQSMAGGSFKAPLFTVAWPTGEFGGMGLEGAVKLGYRRELEAVEDDAEREALLAELIEDAYARGKALSVATYFEIDDVIDPAESRRWIATLFESDLTEAPPAGKHRPFVDTW